MSWKTVPLPEAVRKPDRGPYGLYRPLKKTPGAAEGEEVLRMFSEHAASPMKGAYLEF